YPNYRCVVVENGSADDSAQKLAQFKDIELIRNHENLGFAGGNNSGIKFALKEKFDYILLLNNDTEVNGQFLTFLVAEMEADADVGIAGSKIYYWGSQRKIWSAGGGISRFLKRTYQYAENQMDRGQADQRREVDFVSGCAMLIRREVVEKIGALDPIYFMYYEDVDYCQRAQGAGFKVIYVPQSVVWHKVSATSNRSFRDYYRMRNHIIFMRKIFGYGPLRIAFLSLIVSKERAARILARKFLKGDSESFWKRMLSLSKGYLDGMKFVCWGK
ncbi:MAG: glycosyltransferase family 2 protein, partial [Calditrichaeota bacterium]|nr:glycosyltransferase family 2 protein [Calditrichota bacterium]